MSQPPTCSIVVEALVLGLKERGREGGRERGTGRGEGEEGEILASMIHKIASLVGQPFNFR